jgi:hypothetical protein
LTDAEQEKHLYLLMHAIYLHPSNLRHQHQRTNFRLFPLEGSELLINGIDSLQGNRNLAVLPVLIYPRAEETSQAESCWHFAVQ